MKFFNKKEQVIDLQLTQYGKQQLSKGKLRPTYYAFYDDGVMYDAEYANVTESQNTTQERIKETPQLETQYNFESIESRVVKANKYFRSTKQEQDEVLLEQEAPSFQIQSEKDYALTSVLGTSQLTTDNLPAWDIKLLSGEISSSTSIANNDNNCSYQIVNTPQLRVTDVEYQVNFESVPPSQVQDFIPEFGDVDPEFYGNEYINVVQVGSDLILQIDESNTPFDSENFEIEIFEVTTEPSPNSSCSDQTREVLVPLYFAKRDTGIKNGLIVGGGAKEPFEDPYLQLDPSYVEYYFNVEVDNEIDDSTLCNLTDNKGEGVFNQGMLNCKDVKKEKESSIKNLFKTDVTSIDIEGCGDN